MCKKAKFGREWINSWGGDKEWGRYFVNLKERGDSEVIFRGQEGHKLGELEEEVKTEGR